jgi:hypothetical protein
LIIRLGAFNFYFIFWRVFLILYINLKVNLYLLELSSPELFSYVKIFFWLSRSGGNTRKVNSFFILIFPAVASLNEIEITSTDLKILVKIMSLSLIIKSQLWTEIFYVCLEKRIVDKITIVKCHCLEQRRMYLDGKC